MKSLGIVVQKNYLRYAVLDGEKNNPVLVDKGRQTTTDPTNVPALMDWYETHFEHLLLTHQPNVIGYKLILEPKIEQQHTLAFPLGILNLLAQKKGITVSEYSQRGITPSKLSLPKNTDLMEYVDTVFGTHPPYWDKYQKEAVLVAWFSQ